ncbi:MAG TPA: TetR/AcrR family transcriptional regulator [Amycolatopsis sp.]|uniref:TetR/AcrR family transcriptional regulator n=1 Tax=Amycolatopsis nalaikhensis TaxID=715472 RepID=A0ABY8XIJ2_9PSEU|nr:TetR/AcrR family transcriptional regulator [Amycolatopsis sp. 2-2]WIV55405.1 TetR/AcrR family transcriptional regulator [Amycolatopsis sp. 2-2]
MDESTQERILRVAAEMFARKGYHATGVAELGAAAGLQRGALYYHIKSKEDLLFDLSKRHVEEALARGREVLAKDLPPAAKLRALAREHLRTIAARCAEVTVVIREMHSLTGIRAKRLKELRDEYENLFAAVLREGAAQGVFASADRVVVLGVLGMFNWTHVWLDAERGPLSPDDIADRLTDLIIHGQLAPATAVPAPAAARQ